MTDPLVIAPGEAGLVRLFIVDLSEPELRALAARGPAPDADVLGDRAFVQAAPQLLGSGIDLAHVELFRLNDLAGLGLPGYLAEAYDISDAQLDPQRDTLDALMGFALILPSEATPDGATLAPVPALHLIARFETPKAAISMKRLTSDAGRGWGSGAAPAETASGRAFPARALVIAMLVLAAVALWLWLTLG